MFKVLIQDEGCYDILHPNDVTVPVRIEWDGGVVRANFPAEDYAASSLRGEDWDWVARLSASHVIEEYIYHPGQVSAEALLAWLNDDPDEARLVEVQCAEQEWRVSSAVERVRGALSGLSSDSRRKVFAEFGYQEGENSE